MELHIRDRAQNFIENNILLMYTPTNEPETSVFNFQMEQSNEKKFFPYVCLYIFIGVCFM